MKHEAYSLGQFDGLEPTATTSLRKSIEGKTEDVRPVKAAS